MEGDKNGNRVINQITTTVDGDPTRSVTITIMGPVKERRCQDVAFIVIFALFWIGMFVVANAAFANGNLSNLSVSSSTSTASFYTIALTDVYNAWKYFVSAIFVALALSMIFLVLIRYWTKEVVWSTLVLVNCLLAGLCIYCIVWFLQTLTTYNSGDKSSSVEATLYTSIILAIIFGILFIIVLCMTVFLRRKIIIAIEILKETAKAVGAMPFVMVFPIFIWGLIALLFVYFIYVLLYIVSFNKDVTVIGIKSSASSAQYMILYHLFGFFWAFGFLNGLNVMTIAGVFATYYWSFDKKALPSSPVIKSFLRAITYHTGSIALGSLLLACVQILRVIVYVLRFAAKRLHNPCVSCLCCCVSCLLAEVERIIKFINRNAYIKIAIDGESFCRSASSAMGLLVRNSLKLLGLDFVSEFVLLLAKACITALTVLMFYAIITGQMSTTPINYIYLPLLIIGLVAWMVASAFLSVYHTGIDTIFLSFLEDLEKNDGSILHPYHLPEGLQDILHLSNTTATLKVVSNKVSPTRKNVDDEY